MNDNQNPYNQPQMGQMMPLPPQQGMPMRQRVMRGVAKMKDAFPKWLTQYSIVTYILALVVVSFMYSEHSLPWYYLLSGMVAVLAFFLFGGYLTKETSLDRIRKSQRFEKKIFLYAFIPRLIVMLLIYWIFQTNYGDAFGFENADAQYYQDLGEFVSGLLTKGNWHFVDEITSWNGGHDDIADMGFGIYVGFVYYLFGNSVIVVRLLKCVWSALTVVLIYRLAKRQFGEQTGRIAAIFCALWPNFWYYCGTHLKETEMVFVVVLFVEQADQMLRSRQFTAWKIIPILLLAAAMFTMRTPLGLVALLALVFSVVMSSTKVVSWGKRLIVGTLAIALIGVVAGNTIREQANTLLEQAQSDQQGIANIERSKRSDGNSFAKYAGASIFAPMIFTLPFPTMVKPYEGQDVQQLNNGGNFAKNIVSAFTILAMVMLLMTGKWREHLLPLAFMIGYLIVLVFSSFAQSERFHQPIMPLEFMFAAYGLSVAVTKPKYKRWFMYWCGLMFVVCIAWNWFKMAGRGLA